MLQAIFPVCGNARDVSGSEISRPTPHLLYVGAQVTEADPPHRPVCKLARAASVIRLFFNFSVA